MDNRVNRKQHQKKLPNIKKGSGGESCGWKFEGYINFNFCELVNSTYEDCREAGFFIRLLGRFKEISSRKFTECIASGHQTIVGIEMLPIDQFNRNMQTACWKIDDTARKLTVFRAAGDNRAMVGILVKNIFFLLGIETKIKSLYPHGRSK